jgi:DNA repair exonuclease SbcCD ATPase subunit
LAHLLARLAQYSSAAGPRTASTSEKHDTMAGTEQVAQESAAALMVAQENDAEKEKLYMETMKLITAGRAKLLRQINDYEQLAQDLQTRLDDKELKAVEITNSFNVFKDEILAKAENSRTGMPISKRLIAQFQLTEQKKDEELEKVRLRNISLKQQLKKLEKTLKAREQLAEGLHMIDFEQLKIENQTLNEKIDERNEEFNKLKRKKILTIQVLTHVREKLRFVRKQNAMLRVKIEALDEQINAQRALISVAKKDRDNIKDMNFELKRLQGFAGSDLLLNDFEKRKDGTESIRLAIKELQEKKFLLSQQIRSNNTRIKETLLLQSSQNKVGTFLPPISRK